MKKNRITFPWKVLKKVFWVMRLSFYLVLLSFLQLSANVSAQQAVDLSFRNATLHEVLWELQKQSGCVFVYNTADVESIKLGEVTVKHKTVREVLDRCLKDTDLVYEIHKEVIVIRKMEAGVVPQRFGEIKGMVKDKGGIPLPGVSVRVKGTHTGVATDAAGRFVIGYPEEAKEVVLVFSFVGMKTKEVKVPADKKEISVILEEEQAELDEVIVTGYGNFKKSTYTGSANSMSMKTREDVPVVSFAEMLQGAAPGVAVLGTSGQPGAGNSIRIRGMGSFNAGNEPLYVIDGIPVSDSDLSSVGIGLDPMATISPSDIENVTILKDAAAASLYGSRAANGVVLITTKSGSKGDARFKAKADWGWTDFAMDYREVMGGQERRDLLYEGLINYATVYDAKDPTAAVAYADANIDKYAPVPWCGFVDWNDIMFRKGSHQNYEISASGGSDKIKYYSSLGLMQQDGITVASGLKRMTGRLNIEYKANKKVTLGAKVLFSALNQKSNGEGTSYTTPLYATRVKVTPSDFPYYEDGSYVTSDDPAINGRDVFPGNGGRNPKPSLDLNYQKEKVTRAFNTIYGSYNILKDLQFKSTLSYDYTVVKGDKWKDPDSYDGRKDNGGKESRYKELWKLVWKNHLTYEKTFAKHHDIDALAGYEIDSKARDYVKAHTKNFANPDKDAISNGSVLDEIDGYKMETRLVSYIFRLNYSYRHKYYLGGSYRLDGSSKLDPDHRWGNFWSVSGAWKISKEKFMKPVENVVTDMKLRASYGVNATLPSDYYGYMSLSSYNYTYLQEPGLGESQMKNADLSWETNYTTNVGTDFTLLNALSFTVEYYNRLTRNLLIDRPISKTTGFSSYLMNIGKVRNQGWELEVRSVNFDRNDFSWITSFNLGHNENKILQLDGIQTEIQDGDLIHKVGHPYYTYYLREFAGINPENGKPQYYKNKEAEDEEGNPYTDRSLTESSGSAEKILKSIDPKVTGGLSNTLKYKIFDLNFMLTYSFGGHSYDDAASKLQYSGSQPDYNIPVYYRDRWKQPGDHAKMEMFITGKDGYMGSVTSTHRFHSTDHIRLKNLTFGISVPPTWTKKIGIDKTRLYFAASNLWTWARYDDYDPEVRENGLAGFQTPPLKSMTFGLELNF